MLTLQFANGKEIELLDAHEGPLNYDGCERRVYTFTAMPDVIGLDELNALLNSEANTQTLRLVSQTNATAQTVSVPRGYVLKIRSEIVSTLVESETVDAPSQYEDRLVFQLGRLTYTENQMRKQGIQLEAALAQATYTAMMSDTLLEG